MPEPSTPSPKENEQQRSEIVAQHKRSPIKRMGCGLLLVFWFTILLSPCALFYLAANGEIRIWHGDIPEPHAHPRLLIELISEVDYRGVSVTNSSVLDQNPNDSEICVQTDVRYFLWETIDDNPDVSYCECYAREETDSLWTLTETTTDTCPTNP